MKKLYYTCPIEAAYMEKNFGVKVCTNLEELEEDPLVFILEHAISANYGAEYIHYILPDSQPLFEPEVGDLIIQKGNIRLLDKIGTIKHITKDGQLYLEADYHDNGGAGQGDLIHKVHKSKVEILKRIGKSFITPQEEIDEGESNDRP